MKFTFYRRVIIFHENIADKSHWNKHSKVIEAHSTSNRLVPVSADFPTPPATKINEIID
jgi:hypothetical protein